MRIPSSQGISANSRGFNSTLLITLIMTRNANRLPEESSRGLRGSTFKGDLAERQRKADFIEPGRLGVNFRVGLIGHLHFSRRRSG